MWKKSNSIHHEFSSLSERTIKHYRIFLAAWLLHNVWQSGIHQWAFFANQWDSFPLFSGEKGTPEQQKMNKERKDLYKTCTKNSMKIILFLLNYICDLKLLFSNIRLCKVQKSRSQLQKLFSVSLGKSRKT